MLRLKLTLIALVMCGCSASERIAVEANGIGERAETIHRLALRIGETSQQAEVIADAASIAIEASAIEQKTQAIHATLPGVSDTHPYLNAVKWVALAAAVLAIAWIIHATGLGTAVRIAVGWIPRRKIDTAEMMSATLAHDKPETVRELVAMMRAQDPLLDKAMRQVKHDTHP